MINGSTFGRFFRLTTFGESHGPALGVVVDGCPPGLELDLEFIRAEMGRRKPGQSKYVTQRKENDEFEILSGVFEGKTTGTPLAMVIFNRDAKSKDYSDIKDVFRPGHADFSYFAKYGIRDYRGGGRASARETAARVLAGSIAKQLLAKRGVSFQGGVSQIGGVRAEKYVWEQVENNDFRCLDPDKVEAMRDEIEKARKERDSVGGLVEVQALGLWPGLGDPIFSKLDALIGGAMMSIPAVKGMEIGAGFASVSKRGSQINDEMFADGFSKNDHGGTLGGISSGAPIVVRLAIKPTSSIPQEKNTINTSLEETKISTKGRHDPCVAIRAVPIAEAMLALVLVDCWLQDAAMRGVAEIFQEVPEVPYGMK